ncbi:glycosyltransferase [Dietzia cinnamea]|uniref:Glycosyltransferase involved in cell wall biosynthesis n=1 Tax=Dietzia cinnamea TaxID=321318 RepID=A0A177LG14_9ACTN|nr:glycosyltransferase [Dietzia cinnamea]OAH63501.1 sugar transferase [Dietzia cinnamea]TCW23318.1 glycosyltransferase involved in cell wall biosynthesis [Dietzia cinnamea]
MDARSEQRLDIAVIGPSRFPIREPYAGGLEVVVAKEVRALRARGHRVTLYAAAGSEGHDPRFEFTAMATATGRGDSYYPPGGYEADSAEFERLMDHVAVAGYDVVLNHSLSHVPLVRAAEMDTPMITTLHCPRLEPMQEAFDRLGEATGHVLAVSRSVLGTWRVPQGADVLPNGVDLATWRPGRATGSLRAAPHRAVWTGRIVPEKGPHLAVEAARLAGMPLDLAGRVGDDRYMRRVLRPRLREAGDLVHHHGPLGRDALVPLVASAAVALVTPCWEEPFGLTAVEALACGTPVVALARGGIREILRGQPGVILVDPGDDPASALAAGIPAALTLDRAATARAAAAAFSHDARIDALEERLRALLVGVAS